MPVESALGGQPTSTVAPAGLLSVTLLNRRPLRPSRRSNGTELLPIGLPLSAWSSFSSKPVPSSYNVIENVLVAPATAPDTGVLKPTQHSNPNSGTLIQRTLNALTLANPIAITGNVLNAGPPSGLPNTPVGVVGPTQDEPTTRLDGLRSAQAAAIFGGPIRNSGTLGNGLVSPKPNVMLPFEFQKIEFHTRLMQALALPASEQLDVNSTDCPAASVGEPDVTVKQFPDRENPTTCVPPIITQPPVGNAEAAPDDVSENVLAPAQPVAPMVPDATGKHLAPKMNSNPPDSAPAIGPSGDSLVGLFIVGLGPSASSSSPRTGGLLSATPDHR